MAEHIHIRNLGPIRDIRLKDIKPFTVLIGDSGSGKSTLLKALALCRWIFKMCNIREYLRQSGLQHSPFRFRTAPLLENCGLTSYVTKETEIIYGMDDCALSIRGRGSAKGGELNVSNVRIPQGHLAFNKISFIGEARGVIPSFLASSGSSARRVGLGYYFKEVLDDFLRATQTTPKLDIPFLGVQFVVEKVMYQDKYFLKPLGEDLNPPYKIELRHGSSGMQNTTPLLVILKHFSCDFDFTKAFRRSVLDYLVEADQLVDFRPIANLDDLSKKIHVHIEEPELGLFPDAQCELMNTLVQQCFKTKEKEKKNDLSVIMATHSPYILNHLNLLIKAYDTSNTEFTNGASLNFDDIAAYHVEDGAIGDLKMYNDRLIAPNVLSNTINDIYNQYAELK